MGSRDHLHGVPADWLAQAGLQGFRPDAASYPVGKNEHPDLPAPSIVRLAEIRPVSRSLGVRGLVEERTRSILRAIAAGDPLPPIKLYAAPDGAFAYRLGEGFHRFTVSRALGFEAIPAAVMTYWEPWMTGDPMP